MLSLSIELLDRIDQFLPTVEDRIRFRLAIPRQAVKMSSVLCETIVHYNKLSTPQWESNLNKIQHLFVEGIEGTPDPELIKSLVSLKTIETYCRSWDCWTWPESLECIDLHYCSEVNFEDLKGRTHIKSLKFGHMTKQFLDCLETPTGLHHLTLGPFFYHSLRPLARLPNLTSLKISSIPPHLTDLHNLTHLELSGLINLDPISSLKFPENLTHLTFDVWFNQPLVNVRFPPKLKHLTLGDNFNRSLTDVDFPPGLTHLKFGCNFNRSIHCLHRSCPNLTHLILGDRFDRPLDNVPFPEGLTHLIFGLWFNRPLHRVEFPPELTHLAIGKHFQHSLENITWPSSLKSLILTHHRDVRWLPSGTSLYIREVNKSLY